MSYVKLLKHTFGMTLAMLLLLRCTGPTPIVIVVTATPQSVPGVPGTSVATTSVTAPFPAPTLKPSLPTVTPTKGQPLPSPTPAPVVATIITKSGLTVQLSQFDFPYSCGADIGYSVTGLPTTSGVNVSWNYIQRADIGSPDEKGEIPVIITLVNCECLETKLRWASIKIGGKSDLGDFETGLNQVQSIVLQRNEAIQVPVSPPTSGEGPSATITWNDASIEISGFYFYYFYCDTFWIPTQITEEAEKAVPLDSGLKVDLYKVKEIRFGDVEGNNVAITVVTVDGRMISDTMRTDWRLRGYTNLGEFDFEISSNRPNIITVHSP